MKFASYWGKVKVASQIFTLLKRKCAQTWDLLNPHVSANKAVRDRVTGPQDLHLDGFHANHTMASSGIFLLLPQTAPTCKGFDPRCGGPQTSGEIQATGSSSIQIGISRWTSDSHWMLLGLLLQLFVPFSHGHMHIPQWNTLLVMADQISLPEWFLRTRMCFHLKHLTSPSNRNKQTDITALQSLTPTKQQLS